METQIEKQINSDQSPEKNEIFKIIQYWNKSHNEN